MAEYAWTGGGVLSDEAMRSKLAHESPVMCREV